MLLGWSTWNYNLNYDIKSKYCDTQKLPSQPTNSSSSCPPPPTDRPTTTPPPSTQPTTVVVIAPVFPFWFNRIYWLISNCSKSPLLYDDDDCCGISIEIPPSTTTTTVHDANSGHMLFGRSTSSSRRTVWPRKDSSCECWRRHHVRLYLHRTNEWMEGGRRRRPIDSVVLAAAAEWRWLAIRISGRTQQWHSSPVKGSPEVRY